MNKKFEDFYDRVDYVLCDIDGPIEDMTFKEAKEHFEEMQKALKEYLQVYDDVKFEELCNYKQQST